MAWNKKPDEEQRGRAYAPVAQPVAAPSSPSGAGTAAAPALTPTPPAPPPPVYRPEPARQAAVLGAGMSVKGQIVSKEDLTIDGDVQGTIDATEHRLTIGPTGKVQVDIIRAREVVVMGSLKGSVDATDKVYIRKDAQLVGDVQTAGIVIEDGAYFKGGIDIQRGK